MRTSKMLSIRDKQELKLYLQGFIAACQTVYTRKNSFLIGVLISYCLRNISLDRKELFPKLIINSFHSMEIIPIVVLLIFWSLAIKLVYFTLEKDGYIEESKNHVSQLDHFILKCNQFVLLFGLCVSGFFIQNTIESCLLSIYVLISFVLFSSMVHYFTETLNHPISV